MCACRNPWEEEEAEPALGGWLGKIFLAQRKSSHHRGPPQPPARLQLCGSLVLGSKLIGLGEFKLVVCTVNKLVLYNASVRSDKNGMHYVHAQLLLLR